MKFPERLFNDTSVPVMIFSPKGELRWTNEIFKKLFGWSHSNQNNNLMLDFFSSVDSDRLRFVISQALIGIPIDSIDLPLTIQGKESKDIRWNAVPIHEEEDQGQRAVVLFGVEPDGTRENILDLQSTDALYRILFENTGIAMMFFAEDGTIMLVNKEFEKLTGYTKDIIEGKISWTQLIDNKDDLVRMKRNSWLRRINPALAPDVYDLRIRTREGGSRDTMIRVSVIPGTSYSLVAMPDLTERLLSEEAVRESEEKYRTLVENIQKDTLYRSDLEGNFSFISPSGARLLGYDSYREMLGLNIAKNFYYDPDERSRLLAELHRKGHVTDYGITLKRRDGSPVFISTNSHLYYSRDGRLLGVEGIFSDITERKRTEALIREKEERLRGITDNLPGSVFQFYTKEDGNLGISYASERVARTFGPPQNCDDLFASFLSHTHKDDRERCMISLRWAMDTCTPWDFEGRFHDMSGKIKWYHGLATPARHDGRTVLNGILLDITGRKQAEKLSRQSEEKFSKIFMTTPDFISITGLNDGRIIDVNHGFEDITGWKREEVIGRTVAEVSPWQDPSDRDFLVEELLAGRAVMNHAYTLKCRDGSMRTGTYSARSIVLEEELCIIFVMQDITDRMRMEEERIKLEHQLAHSQRMDAIGQLAGGVAHDFNNILMGIQGNMSLMLMHCDPENPFYNRLNRIEEHIKRGANLTRQLLGFARGGKYEVKTVSINDLIRKSAQLFLETKKEVQTEFILKEDTHRVEADPGQIEQVLLNIYINAGHAMPRGGRLTILTDNIIIGKSDPKTLDLTPGDYVKVSISDTGVGIPGEIIDKIFDPFFTTKSEQGGTGLGLASAYGIIKNHGGAIDVCSEIGQGTTFDIYLPSSEGNPEKEEGLSSRGLISGTGCILIIDDEPMILETASDILETLGYTIYQAASGQDAIGLYRDRQKEIDLIILDMVMPGMSGSDVLKDIKEINPDARIILSSGYGMQSEVSEIMEMGCIAFIQKPYNFSDLSSIVHQSLNPSP